MTPFLLVGLEPMTPKGSRPTAQLTQRVNPLSPEALESLLRVAAPLSQRKVGKDVAVHGSEGLSTYLAHQRQLGNWLMSWTNQAQLDRAVILFLHDRQAKQLPWWATHGGFTLGLLYPGAPWRSR